MKNFWKTERTLSVLHKYQLALVLAGKKPFNEGDVIYGYVDSLIDLRNALVHYKPETLGDSEQGRLERRLRKKFPTNKLMRGAGNPYFPDHCLGYGCSEWAVTSSKKFVDEFFARIGILPNYQKVKL